MNWYCRWGKRLLDIVGSGMALLVLWPVMVFIALFIRITMGTPVLFRQQRPGLHGKPFTLYKFRTMTDVRGAQGNLLPDEQRLTRLGRFLRSASLDDLPELWNVLKGGVSLVGPRPGHRAPSRAAASGGGFGRAGAVSFHRRWPREAPLGAPSPRLGTAKCDFRRSGAQEGDIHPSSASARVPDDFAQFAFVSLGY